MVCVVQRVSICVVSGLQVFLWVGASDWFQWWGNKRGCTYLLTYSLTLRYVWDLCFCTVCVTCPLRCFYVCVPSAGRCFCELAHQIGFSDEATTMFQTLLTLGMYRHIVRQSSSVSIIISLRSSSMIAGINAIWLSVLTGHTNGLVCLFFCLSILRGKKYKKFELMLMRRTKTYSSSASIV